MTNTAGAVITQAQTWVGYREGANNNTIPGAWYGLNYQPWCDMWVSKVADEVGALDVVGKFAYCPSHVNWFKSRDQWQSKYATPQAGDVIFYSWNGDAIADHVGYVVRATSTLASPALAIEGNSSDANTSEGIGVYYHQRSITYILGFGRPAYSTAAGSVPPPILTNQETVSLQHIQVAIQIDGPAPTGNLTGFQHEVYLVERALYDEPGVGLDPRLVDGSAGQSTFGPGGAYQRWQKKLGYKGADADGYPGPTSLTQLGKRHGWRAVA